MKMDLSGRKLVTMPEPKDYVDVTALPDNFSWGNVNGKNYLSKMLNQHLPQYCGACWAHGAASALTDRIRISQPTNSVEFDLSIQYILNCGASAAGSCNGGDQGAAYAFIQQQGYIPTDTAMPYSACSSDSSEGFCGNADWTCTPLNTARTCNTFSSSGGKCVGLTTFPNATVTQYGPVSGEANIMAELYARGPLACGVNAEPLVDYNGGIFSTSDPSGSIDHVVSIVGWGTDANTKQKYWIVRNSWGMCFALFFLNERNLLG